MYSNQTQDVPMEETLWSYRRQLIQQEVATANCDVVCMQEVCSDSFEQDFEFMKSLDYDQCELYKKGRFRPATFWKSSKVELAAEPLHRDRILITPFKRKAVELGSSGTAVQDIYWIVNCHLRAAGKGENLGARRLRQVHDCTESIRKAHMKLRGIKPGSTKSKQVQLDYDIPVVMVGDMNVDGYLEKERNNEHCSSLDAFLLTGSISSNFIEYGMEVTDKERSHPFGKMVDAYAEQYLLEGNRLPPPTMVVENLYGVLTYDHHSTEKEENKVGVNEEEEHPMSQLTLHLLKNIFNDFASISLCNDDGEATKFMSSEDVKRWLLLINKQIGRGSEFRAAAKLMVPIAQVQANSNTKMKSENVATNQSEVEGGDNIDEGSLSIVDGHVLSWDGFLQIYQEEIAAGKIWSLSHDIKVCGYSLPASDKKFTARYDRAYVAGADVLAVRDTGGCVVDCLPNKEHASDHLPIMVVVDRIPKVKC